MDDKNKTTFNLGQYVRDVFDLNRDGKVTFKEFWQTVVPSKAVGITLLTIDALAFVGEIRVWHVGMAISQGDPWKAAGFVAVSIVPFLLAQFMWLYPLATWFQQFLAAVVFVVSLYTSMQFGFADLSQQFNAVAVSQMVTRLWFFYMVVFVLFVVNDRNFKLKRAAITARANARYQEDMNATANDVLLSLRASLEAERKLRDEFGDEAVNAHLEMLRARGNKAGTNHRLPEPANPQKPPQP